PRCEPADALAPRVRHFDARPLAPEVEARSRLQGLGDVRAADARRDFEEVELPSFGAAYELGVCRAAPESERREQPGVQARQLGALRRVVLDGVGDEDAALLHDPQGRATVAARAAED